MIKQKTSLLHTARDVQQHEIKDFIPQLFGSMFEDGRHAFLRAAHRYCGENKNKECLYRALSNGGGYLQLSGSVTMQIYTPGSLSGTELSAEAAGITITALALEGMVWIAESFCEDDEADLLWQNREKLLAYAQQLTEWQKIKNVLSWAEQGSK